MKLLSLFLLGLFLNFTAPAMADYYDPRPTDTYLLTTAGQHGPGLHCYIQRDGEDTKMDADLTRCAGQKAERIHRFNDADQSTGYISVDADGKISEE